MRWSGTPWQHRTADMSSSPAALLQPLLACCGTCGAMVCMMSKEGSGASALERMRGDGRLLKRASRGPRAAAGQRAGAGGLQ